MLVSAGKLINVKQRNIETTLVLKVLLSVAVVLKTITVLD